MQDSTKTRDQIIEELADLRQSLIEPGSANLLLDDDQIISTKRFAAGIAHEINNPLGIISGFAELVLRNAELPQTSRDDVQVIYSECNRAAQVLDDLLNFAGDHQFTIGTVDLKSIVDRALQLKSNELDDYNINVTTRISPAMTEISLDPDQLIEILLDVIDNAKQTMIETWGGGEIAICTDAAEDKIRIAITANGPGIPPVKPDRNLRPRLTTKSDEPEAALGLSNSRGIMQRHGGDLWADICSSGGRTFHLELPKVELPTVEVAAVIESPTTFWSPYGEAELKRAHIDLEAAAGMSQRILVVNNELGYQHFLSRALTPGGHIIDLAADWVEAWKLVHSNSYDKLILDLGLPVVNGMQLYERIKDYNSDLAAKCIFITGYLLAPELESALTDAGVPYLTKPFSISQIRCLVLEMEHPGVIRGD